MTLFLVQLGLLLLAALVAWKWGEWPERYAAGIYIAMMAIDQAYHFITGAWPTWSRPDLWHALLDLAALVAVVAIVIGADRLWTIWLGSAQLLAFGAHPARLIQIGMPELVYSAMARGPVWLAITLPILASFRLHRARRRANLMR